MSPDQVNAKHGSAVWRCFHCRAETGLHWYHGLSVAICRDKPECGAAYDALVERQCAEEQARRERVEEIYGPQPW